MITKKHLKRVRACEGKCSGPLHILDTYLPETYNRLYVPTYLGHLRTFEYLRISANALYKNSCRGSLILTHHKKIVVALRVATFFYTRRTHKRTLRTYVPIARR